MTFDKTFQGLEYLLTKAGLEAGAASALFYPATPLDETQAAQVEELDAQTADEDELMALFDFYTDAITYTAPAEVADLWQQLQAIDPEQLGALYSSRELNE